MLRLQNMLWQNSRKIVSKHLWRIGAALSLATTAAVASLAMSGEHDACQAKHKHNQSNSGPPESDQSNPGQGWMPGGSVSVPSSPGRPGEAQEPEEPTEPKASGDPFLAPANRPQSYGSYHKSPHPSGRRPQWAPAQQAGDGEADPTWDLLTQTRQLLNAGQLQQALATVQQFIRNKPLEPEGYFWQAVIYDELDDTKFALRSYNAAVDTVLKAGMDSADLRVNLGNALLKMGKTEDALWQYRRAVEIDSRLPMAHLNLGRALLQKGQAMQALDCFSRCRDLHFSSPQLFYYSAKAYQQMGRRQEAQSQIQLVLEKLPPGPSRDRIAREFAQTAGSAN